MFRLPPTERKWRRSMETPQVKWIERSPERSCFKRMNGFEEVASSLCNPFVKCMHVLLPGSLACNYSCNHFFNKVS